jgi:hypothetical protein
MKGKYHKQQELVTEAVKASQVAKDALADLFVKFDHCDGMFPHLEPGINWHEYKGIVINLSQNVTNMLIQLDLIKGEYDEQFGKIVDPGS